MGDVIPSKYNASERKELAEAYNDELLLSLIFKFVGKYPEEIKSDMQRQREQYRDGVLFLQIRIVDAKSCYFDISIKKLSPADFNELVAKTGLDSETKEKWMTMFAEQVNQGSQHKVHTTFFVLEDPDDEVLAAVPTELFIEDGKLEVYAHISSTWRLS